MIKTDRDAVDYVKRALVWAQVDMNAIDMHSLPGILDAYDEIETVTEAEAAIINDILIRALQNHLNKEKK